MSFVSFVNRKWPKGAAPRSGGVWAAGGLMVLALLVVWLSDGLSPEPRASTGTAPAQPGRPAQIRQAETMMQQRLASFQQAEAEMQRAKAEMEAQHRATGDLLTRPRDPDYQRQMNQQQQEPVDPVEAEELRFKAEQHRLMLRRFSASPLAVSLRDTYSGSPVRETPPAREPAEEKPPSPPAAAKEPAPDGVPKYMIREGDFLETVLVNRLDSTFSSPVIALVSNDLWSRDRTTVLVPKGTRVIGEARPVEATGQTRLAVIFHRMIRPDDVAINLDQYLGLNQIGETGLKDKVNNHYVKIFGVSVALGVIGALAQGTARYGYDAGGWDYTRQGIGQGMSQSANTVLNRYLNILPTVTIREGHRVKVYFTKDIEVPAYEGVK